MSTLIKKIADIPLAKLDTPASKDFELTYLRLLKKLIMHKELLYCWLTSDSLTSDLEELMHLKHPS